jgi:hypothetical protein
VHLALQQKLLLGNRQHGQWAIAARHYAAKQIELMPMHLCHGMAGLVAALDDHFVNIHMVGQIQAPINALSDVRPSEGVNAVIERLGAGLVFEPHKGKLRLGHAWVYRGNADWLAAKLQPEGVRKRFYAVLAGAVNTAALISLMPSGAAYKENVPPSGFPDVWERGSDRLYYAFHVRPHHGLHVFVGYFPYFVEAGGQAGIGGHNVYPPQTGRRAVNKALHAACVPRVNLAGKNFNSIFFSEFGTKGLYPIQAPCP